LGEDLIESEPPYLQHNIMLKDDKDYIYIGITKEDFLKVITCPKRV